MTDDGPGRTEGKCLGGAPGQERMGLGVGATEEGGVRVGHPTQRLADPLL